MPLLDRWEIEVLRDRPTCRTKRERRVRWRGRYRQGHAVVVSRAELPADSHPTFVREFLYFKFLVGDVEVR